MIADGNAIPESMVDVFGLALTMDYPDLAPVPSVHHDIFAQMEPAAYADVFLSFAREDQVEFAQYLPGNTSESLTREYQWRTGGHPDRTWPVMRSAPLTKVSKAQVGGIEASQASLLASAKEDKGQAVDTMRESRIDQEPSRPQAEGKDGSCVALVSQILFGQRLPTTLTNSEWLYLSSSVSSIPSSEIAAFHEIIGGSIEGLDKPQRLLGISCSLQLGLLDASCWAFCCSQLENYWNQFLVLSDHPSRLQFLKLFVDFIERLEIDEAWGLEIMTGCLTLIRVIKDESVRVAVDLLSMLCRRSQAIADQIYEELCLPCEVHPSVGVSMSWSTLLLISDFYANLDLLFSRGNFKFSEMSQLLRPFEILAAKLKGPSHGTDKSEKFLDCLVRDFKQVKESSAEWIALLCISKLLLSEFVKRPGPLSLKHEQLDAWSSLARVLRGCEKGLTTCTLGTFIARDIKFTILSRTPPLALRPLQSLFESLGASTGTSMKSALSTLGVTSDRYFAAILRLMGDNSASVRVRAIRGLSKLIDSDDPVSKNQNFMKALSNRFEDHSPLVRDAALDFYFSLRKIDDQESAALALSKLDDSSPLVRRRVIKIIELQMGIPELDPSISSELRAALINRVSVEGKALADLSFSSLLHSWLSPLFHKRSELLAKGESIPLRQTMADLTAEIIKTIRSPRTSIVAFQSFSTRIRESARGGEWSLICQEIVDLLFETLISSVESGNDSAVKFILAAIVVFAADSADCVRAHFKLICRLILSNEGETVEHSLSLLRGFLREIDLNLLREAPELVKDLCRLSFRGSTTIVRSAIECLGCLATKDSSAWERLCYLVTKHQAIVESKDQSYGISDGLLRARSLYSLSMLAKAVHSNGVAIEISPDLVIDSLAHVHRADPKVAVLCALSCAELLAIPFVAIKPSLISIIKGILSGSCAVAQVSVLRGFLSLFMGSGRDAVKSSFHSGDNRLPDGTSALSTVFQVYSSEFQRLILEGDPKVDEALTLIFAAALSYGLVPPQALIPHLLCAWHPHNPQIQQKVAFQCASAVQKVEPYLMPVLRQTIKLTYQYLCKTGTLHHQLFCSADGTTESYFHELFECLSTRSRRVEFLSSLIQEVEGQSFASNYLVFLLVSIAQLPFKSDEELHLVLRRVDEHIAVEDDYLETELPRSQQIRQLLVLEAKNYLCNSYRTHPQESTGQGPLDPIPKRLKLDPLRLPDVSEVEKLNAHDLRDKLSSSLHARQGIETESQPSARRMHASRGPKAKRRKKTKAIDTSDEDELSAEEVYY